MTEVVAELAMLEAWHLERTQLLARIARLEAVLREHGLPGPAEDPRLGPSDHEHLEACRAVVRGAYELLPHVEELRRIVGSGIELLGQESWKPPA